MSITTRVLRAGLLAGLFVCAATTSVSAGKIDWPGPRGDGVVVDHPPAPFGGLASDLSFTDFPSPTELWQQVASDFTLSAPATIRRVVWWGFYNEEEPPQAELMRIRFYEPRPSDGLPGDVLFEESFNDPARVDTGNVILIGGLPSEYRFEVDLPNPVSLPVNSPIWFEVVQVGDIESRFRWESSATDGEGLAVRNPNFPDWIVGGVSDSAFQLSTIPEPASLTLFGVAVLALTRRDRKGGVVRSRNSQSLIS